MLDPIQQQFADWITTTFDNMPIVVFLVIAVWDMRKALYKCLGREQSLLDDLIARYVRDQKG